MLRKPLQRAVGRCETAEVRCAEYIPEPRPESINQRVGADGYARYSVADMIVSHKAAFNAVN